MKLNFDSAVRALNGMPLKERVDGEEEKDMTFGSIVTLIMLGTARGDEVLTADKKLQMFKIAKLASTGGVQDVTIEDASFIKERVAKLYAPLIVGRLYEWIEGVYDDK